MKFAESFDFCWFKILVSYNNYSHLSKDCLLLLGSKLLTQLLIDCTLSVTLPAQNAGISSKLI
jgi:hypothetical protein